MNKLSPEQEQIIIATEQLRKRKDNLKRSIIFLNMEIMNIDIKIRQLRQLFPTLAIVEEKPKRISKHVETDEEKLERLKQELAMLESNMQNRTNKGDAL